MADVDIIPSTGGIHNHRQGVFFAQQANTFNKLLTV